MKMRKTPKMNDIIVVCQTCENTMKFTSTSLFDTTDTCRVCHPAYSGKQQVRDTHGRIEKFNSRYANIIAQS